MAKKKGGEGSREEKAAEVTVNKMQGRDSVEEENSDDKSTQEAGLSTQDNQAPETSNEELTGQHLNDLEKMHKPFQDAEDIPDEYVQDLTKLGVNVKDVHSGKIMFVHDEISYIAKSYLWYFKFAVLEDGKDNQIVIAVVNTDSDDEKEAFVSANNTMKESYTSKYFTYEQKFVKRQFVK